MTLLTLPQTMAGIVIETTGGVEVLEYRTNLPVPTLKEGEILVKNTYVGINYIDITLRSGVYPSPKPKILGSEGEGEVVLTGGGDCLGFTAGDRVVFNAPAAYAEYTVAPAAKAYKIPHGFPEGHATAVLLQSFTALMLVRESFPVKNGDWILIHAAAGGVGLLLCQIATALGATVIGTASNTTKLEFAKANGAQYMIDYTTEDIVTRVNEITGGRGVDVVYDSVGKDTFEISLAVLARGGTFVTFGNASGPVPLFNVTVLTSKRLRLCRPSVVGYLQTRADFEDACADIFTLIADKKVNVQIHEVYLLRDVAKAHEDLEGRRTTAP